MDNIVGTSGDDTINAAATTFGALDSIDGGGGTDTLAVALTAAYTGGATIKNIEKLLITQSTAGGFNAAGITGLTDVVTNSSSVDIGVTGLASAANITVQNQDTDVTVTYADSALAGAADSVKLTLNNVAQAGGTAIALNTTTATTGANGIETLTVDLAGNVGGAGGNAVTINTNATQSLKNVVVTGSAAGVLTMGTNLTTTATTIDASAASGGLTLAGLGAAAHTITLGAGNDSVNFGGNLGSTDKADGGAGSNTIVSTAANWNTLNTAAAVLSGITNFQTLRVSDDAANGVSATINAALVGAVNLRLAGQAQAGAETVTVNNLGGSTGTANVRFDAAVAGVTLNVKDATLPGTANVVNLDLRGSTNGGDVYTFTLNGVETVNVTGSSQTTGMTLAMTNAALTTLKLTNTGGATFDTGTLGANVSSVDFSGVTGGGANTITLNGTANTGANVTGSAGADTITGSDQKDVINAGAGNDVIFQTAGADIVNVGSGTDTFVLQDVNAGAAVTAITITGGNTISTAGFDIITGMGSGDILRLADFSAVGAAADNTAVTAVAFNTTFGNNTVNYLRGNYNSSTDTFVINATGVDSMVVYDADALDAVTDLNAVVLVGYASAATAANLAAANNVVSLTLFA